MNRFKIAPLVLLLSPFVSQADTLTVPENTTISSGGGVVNVGPGTTGRYQEIFSADQFQNIGNPFYITEFAWRKGSSEASAQGEIAIPSVEITMSTTAKTPDNVSVPLDMNLGSSLAVVLPASPLTVNLSGNLGAFDFKFPLAERYLYDPAGGNLLIDIRFTAAPGGPLGLSLGKLDVSGGPIRMGIEANGGAMAGFAGPVTQFTFSIIPPTLYLNWSDNTVVLSWTDPTYSLQAAPIVTGVFTNVPDSASPYSAPITGSQMFFRLHWN